ncbi:zinc-dependent alcohol dehydrogenase family protein [Pseudoduganella albidiflava]|uniref:NADPH:quinone reductase n=2 Tax=Pseudoduganella albidiflava TaxID=321983 RepID=A0ABX5RUZ8_9BURK|nr:zinc-dependent alcohol dehydrogenase family protein [Pseudoduganella albidiflava]QBI01766.1 NADPH:quinone reductase [Pseudoduganella albidiflava]
MARVIQFHQHGGPEVLRIEQAEVAPPAPGEVQITVMALGLNRAEALMREGTYIETPALPSGLGLEAAGIVTTLGAGVTSIALGDAVSVVPPVSMSRWPTYAEIVNVPADRIIKHPPGLGWASAAALWMAYLTAYGALVDIAQLTPDDQVVITAASSSVGLAAIQIARHVGATPIAVTRTAQKKQELLEAGAAHVVAMDDEDMAAALVAHTGAAGVRVVFDPVGGPLFIPLTEAMRPGGILVEYGGLSKEPTPFPLSSVLSKRLTLRGYLVHELLTDPHRLAAAQRFILDGVSAGVFRPVIARTFSFDEMVEAHRYMASNAQFGKIVVTL